MAATPARRMSGIRGDSRDGWVPAAPWSASLVESMSQRFSENKMEGKRERHPETPNVEPYVDFWPPHPHIYLHMHVHTHMYTPILICTYTRERERESD